MKLFITILLLSGFVSAKTLKEGDQEYKCSPVKSCDEQLKAAKSEIKKLRKQLAEKETKVTTQVKEVKVVEEITVIKKHIISLLAVKDVSKINAFSNTNSATAEVETKYIPALTYQYQFDNGLVPMLGLSFGNKINPVIGLGIEF